MQKLRKFAKRLKINRYNKGFPEDKKFKLTFRLSAKQKRAPQGVLFFTRTAHDRVSRRNFIEEVYIIIIRVQVLKE